jgi:hypothetical protein
MWISYSPDLRHWGSHKIILAARRGGWWDANKIGLCSPPIETPKGWLTIYHGVRQTASGSIYRLGLALFDLNNPEVCLQRGESWVFGPEAPYERDGDVKDVVFPCGQTIGADGDTIYLYYGAADTCIALATGSIRALLAWLDTNSCPEEVIKWLYELGLAEFIEPFVLPLMPFILPRAVRQKDESNRIGSLDNKHRDSRSEHRHCSDCHCNPSQA